MLLHGLEVVLSQQMCPMEKTNGTALAYAPTSPSVPPLPTVTLRPYQEECVSAFWRPMSATDTERNSWSIHGLQAGEKKLVLVDRSAIWRSLPVDLHSKQASWLRTFKIPHWEALTRSEASDMLDRRFAERERDREHRTVQKEAKRARKEKGKQSSRTTYTGRRAST
jgi:hypothetical protein